MPSAAKAAPNSPMVEAVSGTLTTPAVAAAEAKNEYDERGAEPEKVFTPEESPT